MFFIFFFGFHFLSEILFDFYFLGDRIRLTSPRALINALESVNKKACHWQAFLYFVFGEWRRGRSLMVKNEDLTLSRSRFDTGRLHQPKNTICTTRF